MDALNNAAPRFGQWTRRWRDWLTEPPEFPLVCEIAADYVAAVRHRKGRVEAWATRELPPGAVRPGPLSENILDRKAVQEALEEAAGAVRGNARQCALVVPDLLSRVVLLDLERLPPRAAEAEALLRWRLDKDLPFDVSEAQLSYQTQPGRNGGDEVVAAVCLRDLLRQYEEILEGLRLTPGCVTLSLMATLGWFGARVTTPQLLVKRVPSSLAVAIVQGGAIRLFRSMPLPNGSGAKQSAAQIFEKVFPALVYYEDHWGEPVREARLCGFGAEAEGFATQLREEANCTAAEFDLEGMDLPPSALSGGLPGQALLPGLGWLQAAEA